MKTYLEPEDLEKLEQATTYVRDRLLVRILAHLGCRISEALAITVDDIDFPNKTIRIQHLKDRLHLTCPECNARLARASVFCPKCGTKVEKALAKKIEQRKMRILPIDQETLKLLKTYIDAGQTVLRDGKLYIFDIKRGRAWQIISETAQKVGLEGLINPQTGKMKGVSPHRLRDAFATMAAKTDDSMEGQKQLQEHLGHASFNTTAKYWKLAGEQQRDWYDKLFNGNNKKQAN
jgi:integrase/recombinase XerD